MAQALGRLLFMAGQPIAALAGRTRAHAEAAAAFIGPTVRVVELAELPHLTDRVLIAVADSGIGSVAEALAAAGMRSAATPGLALHTCGAKGPEALAPLQAAGIACGVLHPLQTIAPSADGARSLVGSTFAVAGDAAACAWAEQLVERMRGRVVEIAADHLSVYHAGAVMASNALVGVMDAALVLLAHAGVERREALTALGPLARASLENTLAHGPAAALTGPVVRGDSATVAAHLVAMREVPPSVRALYDAAARHLLEIAKERGLPDASVRTIEAELKKG